MEQPLLILLFLTGVLGPFLPLPRKYYLIPQGQKWSDAQTYCRSNHADLATIENVADMDRIQSNAQFQGFSSSAWIGLYRVWRWSLDNGTLGAVTFWAVDEPAPVDTTTECTLVDPTEPGWVDYQCTRQVHYMCYDERNTGTNRYVYYNNDKSWYAAQSYCRLYHTDLASSRDAAEHAIILGMISDQTWIGLIRDTWKWSDQTNVSVISWAPGEPDNAQMDEHCAILNNNQVAAAQCSTPMPFFCYSIITGQRQMVKMEMQSGQDVNDPAVQAAILEQIQKKHVDHGLENVTVRFKQHPDGKVFQKLNEL